MCQSRPHYPLKYLSPARLQEFPSFIMEEVSRGLSYFVPHLCRFLDAIDKKVV
jgi:hypothetical protein